VKGNEGASTGEFTGESSNLSPSSMKMGEDGMATRLTDGDAGANNDSSLCASTMTGDRISSEVGLEVGCASILIGRKVTSMMGLEVGAEVGEPAGSITTKGASGDEGMLNGATGFSTVGANEGLIPTIVGEVSAPNSGSISSLGKPAGLAIGEAGASSGNEGPGTATGLSLVAVNAGLISAVFIVGVSSSSVMSKVGALISSPAGYAGANGEPSLCASTTTGERLSSAVGLEVGCAYILTGRRAPSSIGHEVGEFAGSVATEGAITGDVGANGASGLSMPDE